MTTADRVQTLIANVSMSKKIFADRLHISAPRLSNYLSGSRSIPEELLVKIADLTNCDLNWLLTGKGPMFNNVPAREDKQARIMRARDLIAIPVAADIAAGTGIEAFDVEPTEQLLLPRALLTLPGPYYAFKVDGESMEPHIQTGDYAVVTAAWHDLDIQSRICAVRTIVGLTLKRFYVEPGHCALLIPLNPNFPVTKYAPGDPDYTIVGLLMLVIRKYV